MKMYVRCGTVGLLAGSLCIPPVTWAQGRAPTLKEEARKYGRVTQGTTRYTHTRPYPLDQLIATSDLVVRAKLVQERSLLRPPDEDFVLTEFRAFVEEVLYNPKHLAVQDNRLTVVREGGVYSFEGNLIVSETKGFPPWHSGETYVLLLVQDKEEPTKFWVRNAAQGVYRIVGSEVESTEVKLGKPRKFLYRPASEFLAELKSAIAWAKPRSQ